MMNCRPGKPFPAKDRIGDFLNQSKNGVIFMSFGSIIKPSAMPKEYKEMILNVFARFPQYDFIWKWDEELPNAPKNVLGITCQKKLFDHIFCTAKFFKQLLVLLFDHSYFTLSV